ncbi:MAG: MBOAT family protein [Nitrospirae bacterium]|nr:MBOAT family protein [Magnetococcales bacterium]
MFFNSYEFIFIFLPVTFIVYQWISWRLEYRLALGWLTLASFFFYGWWNPWNLPILLCSILLNYMVGLGLQRSKFLHVSLSSGQTKGLFIIGVIGNLSLLAYYKYFNFFIDNINSMTGTKLSLESLALPLAISFFTFQQIGYLKDRWKGGVVEHSIDYYFFYVAFFPHLIAGPIVQHWELLPQAVEKKFHVFRFDQWAVGWTLFVMGLFKKVMLADRIGEYATPVFLQAEQWHPLHLVEAWGGALAYTFQIYFDFSGYSDMAVGLGLLFGFQLPINFFSPYKVTSIVDFWQCWHITLSRFLKNFLYVPMGGNRRHGYARYRNLMLTMIIGGLWHGAGWTFIFWGVLHGFYLIVNHAWRGIKRKFLFMRFNRFRSVREWGARLLTFLAVVVAWVFFRAETFQGAFTLLQGMLGFHGILLPLGWSQFFPEWGGILHFSDRFWDFFLGEFGYKQWIFIIGLWIIVWFFPNTVEFMSHHMTLLEHYLQERARRPRIFPNWQPNPIFALGLVCLFISAISFIYAPSEFLYFQF